MQTFAGYHSEWNLGSPGGWDYQRVTQLIGKAAWGRLNRIRPLEVRLDFDQPLFYPVEGFVRMLLAAHRAREGASPGVIAVLAEEETLEVVTENRNLAARLSRNDGITGVLAAPQELELKGGRVCHQGRPVSIIFMDFNTDVLLALHRQHDLSPVLAAVRDNRVINPRGTEPINVKSMFEVITGPARSRFHEETGRRTPWTRRFFPRKTAGPMGEAIGDLVAWTRQHWDDLVLKPERGYSGKGVRVGRIHPDADEAIAAALQEGGYIVQEKVPLEIWAEELPCLEGGTARLNQYQTDFRCLIGPGEVFGFLCRFGGVPTNVGSGGGVQPLALVEGDMGVAEATARINEAMLAMPVEELQEIEELQKRLALEHEFTYLLGPIPVALRPRLITAAQLQAVERYCRGLWDDCLELERMWLAGELDEFIDIEAEELEIARMQPWRGSWAIIASDGLFGFGASPGGAHGHTG